ncbi:P-loop NTPase fold protein [Streptomyces sp. NPDC002523]
MTQDAGHWPWTHPDDITLYRGVVRGCLWDPRISQYYELSAQVSPAILWRAAHERDFVAAVAEASRTEYEEFRRVADLSLCTRSSLERARSDMELDTGSVVAALLVLGVVLRWSLNAWLPGPVLPSWSGPVLYTASVAALVACALRAVSRRSMTALVRVLWFRAVLRRQLRRRAEAREMWRWAVETGGVLPGLHDAARESVGPEPSRDRFSDDSFDGLRHLHSSLYVVASAAEEQLNLRIKQIGSGTIAVCGPRGAGKTTLLRACSVEQRDAGRDFAVFVSAPAEYSPHEFLLTLFATVCEEYLKRFHHKAPELGPYTIRRRRLLSASGRMLSWLLRLIASLAALTAGLYQPVRWILHRFVSPDGAALARGGAAGLWHGIASVWQGSPWIAGCLLVWLGLFLLPPLRRPSVEEPRLWEICVRQLTRLRTVQNVTTGVSFGLPQFLGITPGASSSTSVSSVPFTFPDLVAEYRQVVGRIAEWVGAEHGVRVIIAVDELDRLGDTETARKFLGQIKAVFGLRNVYYLISVAEDVGAAFTRRSLPHRDSTDSSIDDTFYVPPGRIAESEQILALRARHLEHEEVLLAHVLSGGIPRDLIRYARRIAEAHRSGADVDAGSLALRLVQEDLSGTLEGLRTSLSLSSGKEGDGPFLNRLHSLVRVLHPTNTVQERDMEDGLRDLAASRAQPPIGRTEVEDTADSGADGIRQEAIACTYFALTLLQVFARPRFLERRRQIQSADPGGDVERLAEARQELAVSAYSALVILNAFRKAWDLPLVVSPADFPTA